MKAAYRGRARVTIDAEDEEIIMEAVQNPRKSAIEIRQQLGLICHRTTVNRRLIDGGLRSHPAARKPLLFPDDRELRLQFARQYANFPHWNRTFFVDESIFCTDNRNVYRIRR